MGGMTLKCNKCGKPIEFDDEFVSPNSGKKIPLDRVEYGLVPHECPDISLTSLDERLKRLEGIFGNAEVPMARVFKLEQKIAELELTVKGLRLQVEARAR